MAPSVKTPSLMGLVIAVLQVLYGCNATLGDGSAGDGALGSEVVEPPPAEPASPGALTLRRLSRVEYDNTVRDLLGTTLAPGKSFPADDLGEEFDTVGSSLSISPLYALAYERAAGELGSELMTRTDAARQAIVPCSVESEGRSCAARVLSALTRRAFRRPVPTSESDAYLAPFDLAASLGLGPSEGLAASVAAVLLSPAFLFKLEVDQLPDSGTVRALDSHEVAVRLSYTLWSTMPDEQLFALADQGLLTTEEQISAEVSRMLVDPRASALLENFIASWLGYRELEHHEVDAATFPAYVPGLASDMKAEASSFFAEFLTAERPFQETFTAGFTYVSERLAAHYGMSPSPAGPVPTRVDTAGTSRGGLLTLGGVLMSSSFASRTSPVRRGQFVFARLLCGEVPPPPPGVEGLAGDTTGLTLRERMELHRAAPECRGCHAVMDPLGFGLENYDAIGRYRELDEGTPVDASGNLPDGTPFTGALELGGLLAESPEFERCVVRKLSTFAAGRLFDDHDPWLDYLTARAGDGASLSALVRAVLTSQLTRSRQAGAAAPL